MAVQYAAPGVEQLARQRQQQVQRVAWQLRGQCYLLGWAAVAAPDSEAVSAEES